MSASNKKKLRREQATANMTEKQLQEMSESKKLRAYSITFIAVILVVVIAAASIAGYTLVNRSGVFQKHTVAATIDGNEWNTVQMAFYFNDAINAKAEELRSYGENAPLYAMIMGLDMSKPLDEQKYPAEAEGAEEKTWADYFFELALMKAKNDYAKCKLAAEENFTLTEEQLKMIDSQITETEMYVGAMGYRNIKEFLRANYGPGATPAAYREYAERSMLAAAYSAAHADQLTYEDSVIRAHDKENFDTYSSFTFAHYYLSASNYLQGGTKGEDGKTVYSEEEKAAALKASKVDADSLLTAKTPEELDKAIAALKVNAEKENIASSKAENSLYGSVDSSMDHVIVEWLASKDRKAGDITVLENKSTNTDEDGKETTTVNGYYVVLFQGRNDNLRKLANVRHLLVAYKGGTMDAQGQMTYTDEQKKVARQEAESLLKQWKDGAHTEDSFIALVKEKSQDPGSAEEGGLISDISPASGLVESFRSWAVDPSRKPGDVEIVESQFGCHIMYYSSDSQQSYRDLMIENDLRTADMEKWNESLQEATSAEAGDISRLNTGRTVMG